jgi:hypothetical protein
MEEEEGKTAKMAREKRESVAVYVLRGTRRRKERGRRSVFVAAA